MANNRQWRATIDGAAYDIAFKPGVWTGKHKLIINGETVDLPRKAFAGYTGMDVPVRIGPKEGRFVLVENKADIALDGVFLGSGKPYAPLAPIPKWAWIFVALCAAIPVVTLGGALPVVFGLLGVVSCLRVARSQSMKSGVKALACAGITILAWLAFLLVLFLLMSV